MTAKEYFGDWSNVIDTDKVTKILLKLKGEDICPERKDIFKAFKLCSYNDCRVVMLFQDPYPQRGVATGLAIANKADTPEDKISPSLKVLKEAFGKEDIKFDNTLESWAKQGVLLLNSALTCRVNEVGSHFMLWRPFMTKLIENLSWNKPGLVWVLFGNQARSYKYDIKGFQHIIEKLHPAFYARQNTKMTNVFDQVNKIIKGQNGDEIKFYENN